MGGIPVLDLFSAAAGGWSLGLHRAGYHTMAACEAVDWRRTLYAENNPGVRIYDDVRTLTADRILGDFGYLPAFVVGSPPCQDISSANTKGKGVDGERSGLFFEAVRIIGECRPRWFALENSANLRTRGADAVLAALEALGYACWAVVVRAGDIGANHERARSWLIGCDLAQLADAHEAERWPDELAGSIAIGEASRRHESAGQPRGVHRASSAKRDSRDATQDGCGPGFPGRCTEPASRTQLAPCGDAAYSSDAVAAGRDALGGRCGRQEGAGAGRPHGRDAGDEPRQAAGELDAGVRSQEHTSIGATHRGRHSNEDADAAQERPEGQSGRDERRQGEVAERADVPAGWEVGLCPPNRSGTDGCWPLWSLDDLAARVRLDDGLPARVAGTRVAVGGPKGTVAASLIVEAYGDAVVPQIPEAIGCAIQRVERAYAALAA